MNEKQMDYVIEAAQTMNMTRAAENLLISQPALSYQIKAVEKELGFLIFERLGKSLRLTPAGQQLVTSLQRVRLELKNAVEQAQNLGHQYSGSVRLSLANRTALYLLPNAIQDFRYVDAQTQVVPQFQAPSEGIDSFLRGDADLILLPDYEAMKLSHARLYPVFTSRIYLLCLPDDPLAQLKRVRAHDLEGLTLLVNGGSSRRLQKVQQRVIQQAHVHELNSPNHDFTLVQVASRNAICLSPGVYQDHSPEFAWIPFDCDENFPYYLCAHDDDERQSVKALVTILQKLYQETELDV